MSLREVKIPLPEAETTMSIVTQKRCVWNKAFLLGSTYLFTLQRHH